MRSRAWLSSFLLLLVTAHARADFRVFEANAPEDASAEPPAPAESTTTTTTTTTSETGETTTTTTTTTTSTPAPEVAPHVRQPFVDDYRWLDVTGFIQGGFIARLEDRSEGISGGITDDTFWLQRARIGLRAQVFDWLRARFEIEFAPVTQLQDAYLDFLPHDAFQVRIGQFIVPFLQTFRFNELNIAFLDRAIYVPQRPDREFIRFLNPRDVGFMISGRVGDLSPSAMLPVFEYQLGGFIGRGPNIALNDDGVFLWALRLQLHALGLPVGFDRENDLAHNHIPRVAVGFGAYSNCDDRSNWNRGVTTDLEFRYEGFYASGAFVWLRNSGSGYASAPGVHRDGFFLANSSGCAGQPSGMTMPDGTPIPLDFVSRGAHLQVQYVLPRFLDDPILGALSGELLARIDWIDGNSPYTDSDPLFGGGPTSLGYVPPGNYTDPDNPPTRWRLTFGLNFYPTGQNQLRLGINYQLNREAENVVTGMGTFAGVSNDIFWFQVTAGL